MYKTRCAFCPHRTYKHNEKDAIQINFIKPLILATRDVIMEDKLNAGRMVEK